MSGVCHGSLQISSFRGTARVVRCKFAQTMLLPAGFVIEGCHSGAQLIVCTILNPPRFVLFFLGIYRR